MIFVTRTKCSTMKIKELMLIGEDVVVVVMVVIGA
jgi:hypothetical protein